MFCMDGLWLCKTHWSASGEEPTLKWKCSLLSGSRWWVSPRAICTIWMNALEDKKVEPLPPAMLCLWLTCLRGRTSSAHDTCRCQELLFSESGTISTGKWQKWHQFTECRGKENVLSLQELDRNPRSLMKCLKTSLHLRNVFPPLLGPQQMTRYCLRRCKLEAVAWLVPDPNVLPPRADTMKCWCWVPAAFRNTQLGAVPPEYLASMLVLCTEVMLLLNLHAASKAISLSVSESEFIQMFYVFPTILWKRLTAGLLAEGARRSWETRRSW